MTEEVHYTASGRLGWRPGIVVRHNAMGRWHMSLPLLEAYYGKR